MCCVICRIVDLSEDRCSLLMESCVCVMALVIVDNPLCLTGFLVTLHTIHARFLGYIAYNTCKVSWLHSLYRVHSVFHW